MIAYNKDRVCSKNTNSQTGKYLAQMKMLKPEKMWTVCFCEILAQNYAPGAAAPAPTAPGAYALGALIIWRNI